MGRVIQMVKDMVAGFVNIEAEPFVVRALA